MRRLVLAWLPALPPLAPAIAHSAVVDKAGDLRSTVAAFEAAMPRSGSEGYRVPTAEERATMSVAYLLAVRGRLDDAAAVADPLGYEVQRFLDVPTGRVHAVLTERANAIRGWGLYVVALRSRSGLVIEVPHPVADQQTPDLGVLALRDSAARALLVAGTHRNANAERNDAGYRVSDMAHATDSVFQAINDVVAAPGVRILQLHGFAADTVSTCRDLVVSGGFAPAPPLARSLAAALSVRGYGTYLFDGADCGGGLSGTRNAQWPVARAGGAQFVHLEVRNPLRTDAARRAQLAGDLAAVAGPEPDVRAPVARLLSPSCGRPRGFRLARCATSAQRRVAVGGTVSDVGTGVAHVEVTVRGRTRRARLDRARARWTLSLGRLRRGIYSVRVRAVDRAGNRSATALGRIRVR